MIGASQRLRPFRRTDLDAYPVAGELVLVPKRGDQVFALNRSGTSIWDLCDGRHTLAEMLAALRELYRGDEVEILSDVTAALFELQALGLVSTLQPTFPVPSDPATAVLAAPRERPPVHFVFGIEDKPYFHWQLAIYFESLVGQLPSGWSLVVVVCNGHEPVSAELQHIAETYDVVLLTGERLADRHNIDFADGGERYVPMNRVEALAVIGEHVASDDVVCLMDTDLFLFGDLREDLFPTGNAMAKNWIIGQERYFEFSTKGERGISIPRLLEALGFHQEFKPGGVTVFLRGETVRNRKYIKDCFRFLQILYLAGKLGEFPHSGVWVAEMACFALAMVSNEIDMELLDTPQFAVQEPSLETVPEGSFFHYYTDFNDGGFGPFTGSEWHKQLFVGVDMLQLDLGAYLEEAKSPLERRFFELAVAAQRRLHGDTLHA